MWEREKLYLWGWANSFPNFFFFSGFLGCRWRQWQRLVNRQPSVEWGGVGDGTRSEHAFLWAGGGDGGSWLRDSALCVRGAGGERLHDPGGLALPKTKRYSRLAPALYTQETIWNGHGQWLIVMPEVSIQWKAGRNVASSFFLPPSLFRIVTSVPFLLLRTLGGGGVMFLGRPYTCPFEILRSNWLNVCRIYIESSVEPVDELIRFWIWFDWTWNWPPDKVRVSARSNVFPSFSSLASFLFVMQKCYLNVHVQELKVYFLALGYLFIFVTLRTTFCYWCISKISG